jgi:hypothetical protein
MQLAGLDGRDECASLLDLEVDLDLDLERLTAWSQFRQ